MRIAKQTLCMNDFSRTTLVFFVPGTDGSRGHLYGDARAKKYRTHKAFGYRFSLLYFYGKNCYVCSIAH